MTKSMELIKFYHSVISVTSGRLWQAEYMWQIPVCKLGAKLPGKQPHRIRKHAGNIKI